jgi:hypothetical protein
VVWVVARGLRPSHGQPGSYQLARWVSTDALVLTGLANLRVVGYEP